MYIGFFIYNDVKYDLQRINVLTGLKPVILEIFDEWRYALGDETVIGNVDDKTPQELEILISEMRASNKQFVFSSFSPIVFTFLRPDEIFIIEHDKVSHPQQSYGMTMDWITRNILLWSDRHPLVNKMLKEIEDLIDKESYRLAQTKIDEFINHIGIDSAIIDLQVIMDCILFDDEEGEE